MNPNHNQDISVLIADDNADILMSLEGSLERDGLHIFTTTSPQRAMQICIDQNVDIALFDVNMPGISGYELLELIKNNPLTSHIMVILITGYSMDSSDVVEGLNKGAVDYLFKPLDLYITIAKVNSLITLVNSQRQIKEQNIELEKSRQELYVAMEQTQKSREAKEIFLANMSHEIRTPLTSIIGLNHLLKQCVLNPEQQEMVRLMEYSSKSLLGLVNDILESAKIDAGKIAINKSETDIVNLVQTICSLSSPTAAEKGLSLTCHVEPDVHADVLADPLRLNQILLNLINNAIKFTITGGVKVALKAIQKEPDRALLQFTVTDTGIGIPQSSINRLFNRFEQAEVKTWEKFGGTGLGLSIVKRIIELQGGELTVHSNPGRGTCFTFTNWYTLAAPSKKTAAGASQPSALSKFPGVRILLAEDNAINQFVTTRILNEWDIHVDTAINGLEALEYLESNHYHLILMDTHMPVMNGYEAMRKIRGEMQGVKKEIPIISFSASVIESETIEAKNAGANDFINKPFEPSTLHRKIFDLLETKQLA